MSSLAEAPNRTASAPTDSESASSFGVNGGVVAITANSSSGFQVVPLSPVDQTPPFAAPTYTRVPPGPTASELTRPLTVGSPVAWPCRITEGPSGVQFTAPGPPGACGGAGIPRSRMRISSSRWCSARRCRDARKTPARIPRPSGPVLVDMNQSLRPPGLSLSSISVLGANSGAAPCAMISSVGNFIWP